MRFAGMGEKQGNSEVYAEFHSPAVIVGLKTCVLVVLKEESLPQEDITEGEEPVTEHHLGPVLGT
jgi:hypothetical protein